MQGMKKDSKLRFRVEGIAKIDSAQDSKKASNGFKMIQKLCVLHSGAI